MAKLIESRKKHLFCERVQIPGLKTQDREIPTTVFYPRFKGTRSIFLTAEHVKNAMEQGGVKNMSLCSGTQCASSAETKEVLRGVLPSNVLDRGEFGMYADFQMHRVFILGKLDKLGLPSVSFGFAHNDPDVPKINDLGKEGQELLYRDLLKNGPREIQLSQVPLGNKGDRNPPTGKKGKGGKGGKGHGAKRRFANVSLGQVPLTAET